MDSEVERACPISRLLPASEGIQVIPGMPAQVFIKTGHGTVALYALMPLLDSFHNAFRED